MADDLPAASEIFVATPFHSKAFAAVHRRTFESAWSAAGFERMLGQPNMLGLGIIAKQADDLIGFILCRFAAPEAEIVTIAVAPDYRRQGFAQMLLEKAEDLLKRSSVEEWYLEVETGNIPAENLYVGAGFERVGRREDYYKHGGERQDALIMRKILK